VKAFDDTEVEEARKFVAIRRPVFVVHRWRGGRDLVVPSF
jgi:hypothetical protein